MKRGFAAALVLTLVAAIAWPALGATSTTSKSSKSSRSSRKPATQPAPAAVRTARGELLNLNVETRSLTLAVVRKQQTSELNLTATDKTEVRISGETATLADLKVGMTIRATMDADGVVTRLDAQPAPKSDKKHASAAH